MKTKTVRTDIRILDLNSDVEPEPIAALYASILYAIYSNKPESEEGFYSLIRFEIDLVKNAGFYPVVASSSIERDDNGIRDVRLYSVDIEV